MDESIQDKISEIMSDPEAMSQIQSLSQMLGLGGSQPALPEKKESDELFSDEALGKLTQLMPLISRARQEDDTTRLLSALRPFLSEEKCRKLDSAKRILTMIKLLPALKDVGVFELF